MNADQTTLENTQHQVVPTQVNTNVVVDSNDENDWLTADTAYKADPASDECEACQ